MLPAAAGDRYFSLRRRERGGNLYRDLGIRWVRRCITNGDWINRIVRPKYPGYLPSGGRHGLASFEAGCRAAERGHLSLFLGGFATAAFAVLIGESDWAAAITAGNIVGNMFPIALQRYNRGRVERVGKLAEAPRRMPEWLPVDNMRMETGASPTDAGPWFRI